jgi:DNA-binding transcriptional regulator LsrR (DeoR family)
VAQKLGGRHYGLPAPAVVERASARDVFLQEPSVSHGIERARAVRLAITGIGAVTDDVSSWLRAGILTRTDLQSLRSQGAVGEICGRFFDIEGCCETFEINERVIGIGPEDLVRIPQSIAIARGLPKARSILGALRGRYIKVLATDDITARAVIEAASKKPGTNTP